MLKARIIGNIGGSPELRQVNVRGEQVNVASFSIAAEQYGKRDGDQPKVWVRVNAWRDQAELVNRLLAKGMQILVEGTYKDHIYFDSEGTPRIGRDLDLKDFQILRWRSADQPSTTPNTTAHTPVAAEATPTGTGFGPNSDDPIF